MLHFDPRSALLASLLAPTLLVGATAHAEGGGFDTDEGETDGFDPSIAIVDPIDGAHLGDAPAAITVHAQSNESPDTMGLLVDDVQIDQTCEATSSCMFTVELGEGEHRLEALFSSPRAELLSNPVTVTVGAPSGGTGGGAGPEPEPAPEPELSCSVSTPGGGAGFGLAFVLVAAGAVARRRR